jgi:hypothetical protein
MLIRQTKTERRLTIRGLAVTLLCLLVWDLAWQRQLEELIDGAGGDADHDDGLLARRVASPLRSVR